MKQIIFLLSFLIGAESSLAINDEAVESIDREKMTNKLPGKEASDAPEVVPAPSFEKDAGVSFDLSRESIATMTLPAGNSIIPSGVSLSEFLEFGMVPVEDLEAELAAPIKNPGLTATSPKGKYYTVYSRAISTGSSGTGATPVSIDGLEVSEDDPEGDEDEEDDDDSEETNL